MVPQSTLPRHLNRWLLLCKCKTNLGLSVIFFLMVQIMHACICVSVCGIFVNPTHCPSIRSPPLAHPTGCRDADRSAKTVISVSSRPTIPQTLVRVLCQCCERVGGRLACSSVCVCVGVSVWRCVSVCQPLCLQDTWGCSRLGWMNYSTLRRS